jgi:hypothetical protein
MEAWLHNILVSALMEMVVSQNTGSFFPSPSNESVK